MLVCAPVPAEFEIAASDISEALDEAIRRATGQAIRGKAVTPFLLGEMEKLTKGKTVDTNRALLTNNAGIAASIAVSLTGIIDVTTGV